MRAGFFSRGIIAAAIAVVFFPAAGFGQPRTGVAGWGGTGVGGVPIPAGLTNVVAVAAQGQWLGLNADGTIVGVSGISNVTAIASGYDHNLAVTNGIVFGWGSGSSAPPGSLSNVVQVGAGVGDNVALSSDGSVTGWGYNAYGQASVPAGLTNATEISGGYFHNLALRSDGTVAAWGYNGDGETNVPSGLSNVIHLAAGYYHSLALKSDGTVIGWGSNGTGQRDAPAGLSNVVAIAAGGEFSLALKSDGTVIAWGDNSYGQTNVPAGLSNVVAIAGAYDYVVALTNDGSPWIIRQPLDHLANSGSSASFSAVALGQQPFSYQWKSNGVDMAGETHAVLMLTNVQMNAAGNYQVVIANGIGSTVSSNAVLMVQPGPIISIQPQDPTTYGGSNITFVANVTGNGTFSYQWQYNGTNIGGATGSSLTLTNVIVPQNGAYSITLSNSAGSVTSPSSSLTVIPWVAASVFPGTVTVGTGQQVGWTLKEGGFTTNATYQWRKDGVSLGSFWLWTSPVEAAVGGVTMTNAGAYDVVAVDSYSSVTSSPVTLTVIPLAITSQPTNRGAWIGGSANFTASAVGAPPLRYQWQLNGTDVPGATTNTLVVTNVQAAQFGAYVLVVTNAYTNLTTSSAILGPSEVAVWGGTSGEINLPLGLTNLIAVAAGQMPGYGCLVLSSNGQAIEWPAPLSTFGNNVQGARGLIALAASTYGGYGLRPNGQVTEWPLDGLGIVNSISNVVSISSYGLSLLGVNTSGKITGPGNPAGGGGSSLYAFLSNVVSIVQGAQHIVVLKNDGTVIAFGNNTYGQTNVPVGLSNVIAIAAGANHSLALRGDGTIIGWGLNGNGQTTIPLGLSNVVAICSGYAHSMALRADGTVVAWGSNVNGQTNVPAGLSNVIAIAAGPAFSMALIGNGPPVKKAMLSNSAYGPNGFNVSLPSQSGRVYALEYKESFTDTNWTALSLTAGNGGTAVLTDAAPTNSQRFYRVRRW
jgi:alpha-tubulin suppressor-like RCC1 family protein